MYFCSQTECTEKPNKSSLEKTEFFVVQFNSLPPLFMQHRTYTPLPPIKTYPHRPDSTLRGCAISFLLDNPDWDS